MGATIERVVPVAHGAEANEWRVQERLVTIGLLGIDLAALSLAFALAYLARFANPWLPYYGPFSAAYYARLMVWCVPLYLLLFAVSHLYDPHTLFGGTKEYARVLVACTFGVMVVIVYSFADRDGDVVVSRGWLLAAWLLSVLAAGAGRFSYRRLIYRLRRTGHFLANAVILGTNEEALAVGEELQANPMSGLRLVGFVGDRLPAGSHVLNGLHLLGGDADLPQLIYDLNIHEVVIAPTAVSRERLLDIHNTISSNPNVHLRLSSGLFEILTTGVQVQDVGSVPLISLNRLRITGIDSFLKTALDYGLIIPGIIILTPFLLLIALLVKLGSPGPVIHRRRVLGMGGRPFDAYKFRTMVSNADAALAGMMERDPVLKREYESGQKLKDDPRITLIGRTLRKYSLDELPQVLNVLKGEMSLVGPRMIAPEEAPRYGKWAMNLLTVKPGITGPWQVMGRADLPYEERVRLSMQYIRNYSIWTDVKILLQTVMVVIHGTGAY